MAFANYFCTFLDPMCTGLVDSFCKELRQNMSDIPNVSRHHCISKAKKSSSEEKKERLPFLLFLLGLLCIKFHCVISIQKCQERKEIVSLSLYSFSHHFHHFSVKLVWVLLACASLNKKGNIKLQNRLYLVNKKDFEDWCRVVSTKKKAIEADFECIWTKIFTHLCNNLHLADLYWNLWKGSVQNWH